MWQHTRLLTRVVSSAKLQLRSFSLPGSFEAASPSLHHSQLPTIPVSVLNTSSSSLVADTLKLKPNDGTITTKIAPPPSATPLVSSEMSGTTTPVADVKATSPPSSPPSQTLTNNSASVEQPKIVSNVGKAIKAPEPPMLNSYKPAFVDTHRIVSFLQEGFTREQAYIIAQHFDHIVRERTIDLDTQTLSLPEFEIAKIKYSSELKNVRNELRTLERNEFVAIKSEMQLLERDLNSFQQKFRDDLAKLRTTLTIDFNNQKTAVLEDRKAQERRILDTSYRLQVALSDLRTMLESAKLDIVKYSMVSLFGTLLLGIVFWWLTLDHTSSNGRSGVEDVDQSSHSNNHSNTSSSRSSKPSSHQSSKASNVQSPQRINEFQDESDRLFDSRQAESPPSLLFGFFKT